MVLIGGISKNSLNKRFFAAVEGLGEKSLEFTVFDIARLPFYSQDIENEPPASVAELRELASASDAVLIVTPEYNRSIPGVLKNALDWGSRPPGQSVWARKPTAIMGATTGGVGTFGAQQHLRNVCSWLDMPVMNQPAVYFNASTGILWNIENLPDPRRRPPDRQFGGFPAQVPRRVRGVDCAFLEINH